MELARSIGEIAIVSTVKKPKPLTSNQISICTAVIPGPFLIPKSEIFPQYGDLSHIINEVIPILRT
jgi:hypothetical protein